MKDWLEADFIFFGFGKITENIISSLVENDKQIICVSNLQKAKILTPNVKWFRREEIIQNKVKAHTAIFAWSDPSPINNKMMLNWIKSDLLSLNCSFLLSSSSVYKDSRENLSEDHNNLEHNFKNNEKYDLEHKLTELFISKQIHHCNLRISNVYGSGLSYGFIASLISSIRNANPPIVFKQKDIVRDYLSIKDLIFAIESLVNVNNTEVDINISTGIGVTIREILEIFRGNGYNFNSQIEIDVPIKLKKSVVLDCSLLGSKIDWSPTSVKIGISELLKESGFTSKFKA